MIFKLPWGENNDAAYRLTDELREAIVKYGYEVVGLDLYDHKKLLVVYIIPSSNYPYPPPAEDYRQTKLNVVSFGFDVPPVPSMSDVDSIIGKVKTAVEYWLSVNVALVA